LADGNRRRLRERGERDGKEEERGQQAPRGDDSGGCNAELGNAPSERPRGGSEDGAGEQSEVPGQGLGEAGELVHANDNRHREDARRCEEAGGVSEEHRAEVRGGVSQRTSGQQEPDGGHGEAGAGVGLADPENPDGERREGESEQMQSGGRGRPSESQIIKPLGGNPDGSTDRLDGPDLLAAYHALGSSVHSRVDELRALGNGVIPAVSATAFLTLYDELTK